MKSICSNLLLIFTFPLFFSCQKDLSLENGGTVINPPDLSTKVSSSVSGFVTDENDAAVMGATVQFGTASITTDKYGYFEAKNVQVVKEAAVVKVIKPGYFKGIKTYMAKEGKAAFFRIKLIPKTNVGTINGTSGGSVTLTNGLSIALPAGAFVNAATNIAYTGTVNIAAYWINPTAADLNSIMPGDLRGIDKDGSLKLLQTFGMAAVELTGASGELLQVATGKKANITLPIPSTLSATAPAAIPLWYFDEAKGLWKEEGSATKTGNTYVGDVSHFSFWDWSTPASYVNLDCTIKDATGNPVPNVWVRISLVSDPNNGRFGLTDANGFVSGPVPDNTELVLDVFSTSTMICTPAHSQTFSTTSSNISLGNITVTPNASWAIVNASITDCSNNPVTNGYVIAKINNSYFGRYYLNNTGLFNFSHPLCNTTSAVIEIIAVDENNQQESTGTYNITGGTNNIGNITACGNSSQEFVNYSVNNVNYSITDTLSENANGNIINIYARTINNTNNAFIAFNSQNIGINSIQSLASFTCLQITEQTTILNPISVNITEYGSPGQFMSGNFTGIVTGLAAPNNTYAITCNFRVRRF